MKSSSFWDITVPRVLSTYAVLIFAVLWVGFVIALLVNQDLMDQLWDWVRALPIVAEVIVWIVLLPIMVGLWIWESSWSTFLRLLGFAGIIGWTLVALSSFVRAIR